MPVLVESDYVWYQGRQWKVVASRPDLSLRIRDINGTELDVPYQRVSYAG